MVGNAPRFPFANLAARPVNELQVIPERNRIDPGGMNVRVLRVIGMRDSRHRRQGLVFQTASRHALQSLLHTGELRLPRRIGNARPNRIHIFAEEKITVKHCFT